MHNSIIPLFIAKLNIARRGHFKTIKVRASIRVMDLLKMFEELGIIRGYKILEKNFIKVYLKYVGNYSFRNIKLISKSSRRIYVNKIQLFKLKDKNAGIYIYIISTNKGLKFDYECYREGIGGELFAKIIF